MTSTATDLPEIDLLARRLEGFATVGGAAFDPPGLACALALLARAFELEGGARVRLTARAAERLARLEHAFHEARGAARLELDALAHAGIADDGLAKAFATGDLKTVLWHAPRRAREAKRLPRAAPRCDAARARFGASAAEANAAVTVARAEGALPEASGPYNGMVLAVRALQELSALSSRYLATYISGLDDLASLATLPAPAGARTVTRRRGRG